MFGSKAKTDPSDPTVIGRGTVIEGTLRVSGPLQVDGQIDGALIAEGRVSVGRSGTILGDVLAEELTVGGKVDGRVCVRDHLHIAPGGSARGDIRYGSLQVDRGGVLIGSTLHGEEVTTIEIGAAEDALPEPPSLPAALRA